MYCIWEQHFPTSVGVLAKLTENVIVISLLSLITCHTHTYTKIRERAHRHVLENSKYVPYLGRSISPCMSQITKSTFITSGAERLQ